MLIWLFKSDEKMLIFNAFKGALLPFVAAHTQTYLTIALTCINPLAPSKAKTPFNPLKMTGNFLMGTLANRIDPDEMLHSAAFEQTVKTQMKCHIMWHFIWVCTVCKNKINLQWKKYIFFLNDNLPSLNIYNGPSCIYCIRLYGKFHWSEMG